MITPKLIIIQMRYLFKISILFDLYVLTYRHETVFSKNQKILKFLFDHQP